MKSIKGRILLVENEKLFRSIGACVEISNDNGENWRVFCRFPDVLIKKAMSNFDISSRLLRLGVHHFIPSGNGSYFAIYNSSVFQIDLDGEILAGPEPLMGNRPLCVDCYNGNLVYGRYTSNQERESVPLYSFDGVRHHILAQIEGVRHIHGVFKDPFTGSLYITTGDYADEAAIWLFSHGQVKRLIGGGQQCRAVQLLFDDAYIYYATDTPLEKNYIYRLSRASHALDRLGSISSSVFYGTSYHSFMAFSTVVEPSKVNESKYVELWVTRDKVNWIKAICLKKDLWPMRLFQYGQIKFPYNFGRSDSLWFYCMGTKFSGRSFAVSWKDMFE